MWWSNATFVAEKDMKPIRVSNFRANLASVFQEIWLKRKVFLVKCAQGEYVIVMSPYTYRELRTMQIADWKAWRLWNFAQKLFRTESEDRL